MFGKGRLRTLVGLAALALGDVALVPVPARAATTDSGGTRLDYATALTALPA